MENEQIKQFKKIKFELVQKDLLEALNNIYIVDDAVNDVVDELKALTYNINADEMISNIKNGDLANTISILHELLDNADKALSTIESIECNVNNDWFLEKRR